MLNRAIVAVVRTRVQQRSLRPGTWKVEGELKRVGVEAKRKGRYLYRPFPNQAIGLLVLAAGVAVLAETVAAINWAIPPRAEGYHSICATLGAGYWVHFPGTITPASPFLIAPGRTAGLASFGFIDEPAGIEEFLLPCGEYKFTPTICTY